MCEDANSKLVEVVTVADVSDEDRVQNLGREQKGFIKGTFISFQSGFVAAEARVINSGSSPLFPPSFLFRAAGSQDDVLFQCSRFYSSFVLIWKRIPKLGRTFDHD